MDSVMGIITNNIKRSQNNLFQSFNNISSGKKINSAKDNAALLAISLDLTSEIQALSQAERNANDAISIAVTANGALQEVTGILQRARELALDQEPNDAELSQLQQQLNDTIHSADFNGHKLFENSTLVFQTGSDPLQTTNINLSKPINNLGNLDDLEHIDTALHSLSVLQAELGAVQSRLAVSVDSLQDNRINLMATGSRITDTDLAEETANALQHQIAVQTGLAVLAQANISRKAVVSLLDKT